MENVSKEVINQSWDINSITVYGALVALLVTAIFLLWRENKANSTKLFTLLESNIAVISTFTQKFDGDGAVLRDKQLESTMRGIVQQELAGVSKALEDLSKQR